MQALADFLFRAERRGEVRFLLIGGRALEAHGYVRNTKDVDLLIASNDVPAMDRLLTSTGYHKEAENEVFSRWRHRTMEAEDVDVMFVSISTFETLAKDAVTMKLGSAEVRIPSVPNIAALKFHAMKNNPDRFGKDAADILALMERYPAVLNPEKLRQLCHRFGTPALWTKLAQLLP